MLVKRDFRLRTFVALAFSYVFYGWWDWRYLGLILLSSTIDWYLGKEIGASTDERQRKRLLITSIFLNVGILVFFKYTNFLVSNSSEVLKFFDSELNTTYYDIILPVGISFFTFQAMSYTIDVYRKDCEVCENYFEFLLFVSFFPQLVAGPIVRAKELIPQLKDEPVIYIDNFYKGLGLFGIGLFKKLIFADLLALLFVDQFFKQPEGRSSIDSILGVYGYSFQIYSDFSGYTDMAIGVALMIGYHFNENFKSPYISSSMKEFWARWHISLSTWLRDYLYIPLGGNRSPSLLFKYRNIAITMILGGLWHGANWTFILWGLIHTVAIVINHVAHDLTLVTRLRSSKLLNWFMVYHTVCLAWIFFRAESVKSAFTIIQNIIGLNFQKMTAGPLYIFLLLAAWLFHVWEWKYKEKFLNLFSEAPLLAKAAYAGAGIIIIFMFSNEFSSFIYFQF